MRTPMALSSETLPPRSRKVKILATLGPASSDARMIRKLLIAGADAFRINMSHGDQKQKARLVTAIRALEKEFHPPAPTPPVPPRAAHPAAHDPFRPPGAQAARRPLQGRQRVARKGPPLHFRSGPVDRRRAARAVAP